MILVLGPFKSFFSLGVNAHVIDPGAACDKYRESATRNCF
jgi:hypothetical protein